MNKNESKYFNTAVKMDKALVTLLEKKDFEYITVKEICDTAGVNRSTFYLHYDNTVSTTLKGNIFKGPFHIPRLYLIMALLNETGDIRKYMGA